MYKLDSLIFFDLVKLLSKPFQGMPIVMITAGLMAIAFCGFAGLF